MIFGDTQLASSGWLTTLYGLNRNHLMLTLKSSWPDQSSMNVDSLRFNSFFQSDVELTLPLTWRGRTDLGFGLNKSKYYIIPVSHRLANTCFCVTEFMKWHTKLRVLVLTIDLTPIQYSRAALIWVYVVHA